MYDTAPVETLKYHHEMLMDKVRVESYMKAILSAVRKGDVVLDLGCGTGILSLFACHAGAKRVYAVEAEPVIEVARRIIDDNGYSDRVFFMNAWSTYIDLPEKVDVILTETVGNLGFEEGILGWVKDARDRFLTEGGRIIPREIELFMVPVVYDPDRDRSAAWKSDLYGFDFSTVKTIADNMISTMRLNPDDLLSPPASIMNVNLNNEYQSMYEADAHFEIERNGVLQGLAGWFRATLTENISLTSAPPNNVPSWWQNFFPFAQLSEVKAGDQLQLKITMDRDGGVWSWKVKFIKDRSSLPGELDSWDFEHHTNRGEILPNRLAQDFQVRPTLKQESYLDLHILKSMDGEHSIEEIAADVLERFPGTFRNLETAREHVFSFYEDYGRIA